MHGFGVPIKYQARFEDLWGEQIASLFSLKPGEDVVAASVKLLDIP